MMRAFSEDMRGESKVEIEAADRGMVEGRCADAQRAGEGEIVGDGGGEEIEAVAGRRGAEGDEAQSQIPVGEAEEGIVRVLRE